MRSRSRWQARTLLGVALASALAALPAVPAFAQEPGPVPVTDLTVTPTYPSVEVDPGGSATFPLSVLVPTPARVDLAVTEVPDGFRTAIRGGGAIVGSVFTNATVSPDLELRVEVPAGAAPGSYPVVLTAASAGVTAELAVDLVVADTDAGSIGLTTDFPALEGPSDASFQFTLRLTNDTSQELTFGLSGSAPEGWEVQVRPTGQDLAATAIVGAGESQNIRVTVTPARFAAAGAYPIAVIADAGQDRRAAAELLVGLTGSFAAKLDGGDGRLNTTVTAGSSADYAVAVTNTGTAPLTGVTLSATPPSGWTIAFDTEAIAEIPVGETVRATARITPAANAVAGDYVITMRAAAGSVSESIQVRTTVETSSTWGLIGIGLIVLVLLGLGLVFRRYGRR
ncbi:MAG: NEW3 domain-containing protein [Chloroflexota bacterium]